MDGVSVQEAARRLGVSQDTIRRRIRRGRLAARREATPQGYIWLVQLPEVELEPEPVASSALAEDVLRSIRVIMREFASLRAELRAYRQEVRALRAAVETEDARESGSR